MEKAGRWKKSRILNFIPRNASAVTFQYHSPPLSPTHRETKLRAAAAGGRSSIIPEEARRKPRNDALREPSSPVVSCIGRIKSRKKVNVEEEKKRAKKKNESRSRSTRVDHPLTDESGSSELAPVAGVKKRWDPWGLGKIFCRSGRKLHEVSNANFHENHQHHQPARADGGSGRREAPDLNQIRRFASGRDRDALANFDWKGVGDAKAPGLQVHDRIETNRIGA